MTHGTKDNIVLPEMGELTLSLSPHAEKSFYDGIGHAPFMEDVDRFNREIATLARSVGAGQETVRTAS